MLPLRIQVLFHWESSDARRLAQHLYRTFSARPTGAGYRIPLRYGPRRPGGRPPDALDLETDHEVVVALIDERMARRVRASDRPVADAWASLIGELVEAHRPVSDSPHRVIPVVLDQQALGLSPDLDTTSVVRLDVREGANRCRHLVLQVAVRALRLLQGAEDRAGEAIDALPRAPVRFFLSHAKRDLPRDPAAMAAGPVKAILAALTETPVEGWYDASEIPAGGRFDEEIRSDVLESSVLVAVLTDAWSSREWCRREILEAKLAGRPIVLVDALQAQVVRLFPYVGNVPTLRWRAAIAAPDPLPEGTEEAWGRQRGLWEHEDAALVIEAALLEALRYLHDHRRLQAVAGEKDLVLGTPPEALTLAHLPPGTKRIWYPDPPLGREELDRLQSAENGGLGDRIDLVTPLGALARRQRPTGLERVAVSLSGAPDSEAFGGSAEHLATFADDIALYLLLAGLRVAYGGVLGHDALRDGAAEGDDINYVDRLLAMARSHSPLMQQVAGEAPAPIENWVAWPIHCEFGDDELKAYGQEAVLEDLGPPLDLQLGADGLPASDAEFFPPDTPARRYAWARSLTFMRTSMLEKTSARVLMGGKLTGYTGLWPGVLEEGVIALRAGQPLYPLGVFGGAARLMIDLLQGRALDEMTSGWFADEVEGWRELKAEYARHGQPTQSPEELASEIAEAGKDGLELALNNGLTEEENEELITSDDSQRAVALVLEGLQRRLTDGAS